MRLRKFPFIGLILFLGVVSSFSFLPFDYFDDEKKSVEPKLKSFLNNEKRVQCIFVSENDKSNTYYLFSYEPISNRFAGIYLPSKSRIISPESGDVNQIQEIHDQSGINGLRRNLERVLDIDIHYWIKANPDSLKTIIDLVGGIQLNFPLSKDRTSRGNVPTTNTHWIDGDIAKEFALTAYRKHGSLGRRFRHKTLFLGIINSISSQNSLISSEKTIKRALKTLNSNFHRKDIRTLTDILNGLDQKRIKFPNTAILRPSNTQNRRLNPREVRNMLPKPLKKLIKESEPLETIKVQVLNGAGVSGLASTIRDQLQKKSYVDVVEVGNANRYDYETTQIIVRNKNPRSGDRIRKILKTGEIVSKSSDNLMVDVTIIAGRDLTSKFLNRSNK